MLCRRLRLSNKRIAEAVDASGGMEFLQASGFQMLFEPDATTSAEEGCDAVACCASPASILRPAGTPSCTIPWLLSLNRLLTVKLDYSELIRSLRCVNLPFAKP